MENYVIGWFVVGAILALLEFVVPGAILGFVGLSCIVVGLLVHFGTLEGWVDILLAWFAISIFCILVLRSFCLKLMPGDATVDNTDEDKEVYGSVVEVVKAIPPGGIGRIRFRDTTWQAIAGVPLKEGDKAIIVGRQESTWIVEPGKNLES